MALSAPIREYHAALQQHRASMNLEGWSDLQRLESEILQETG